MGTKKTKAKAKQSVLRTIHDSKAAYAAAVTVAIILAVIAGLYFVRSWIRATVVPKTVQAVHLNGVSNAAGSEMAKLGESLGVFGFNTVQPSKHCTMTAAQGFKEEVTCTYTFENTITFPASESDAKALVTASENVQRALQDNDWQGTYTNDQPTASLTTLVQNIAKGIDYTPDAAYNKMIGDVTCLFDSNTAFKVPENPEKRMASRFTCSRTFYIFGHVTQNETLLLPDDVVPAPTGGLGL